MSALISMEQVNNRFRILTAYSPVCLSFRIDYPEDGTHVVYGLWDSRQKEFFYIGRTHHFFRRMMAHCRIENSRHENAPRSLLAQLSDRKFKLHNLGLCVNVAVLATCVDADTAKVVEAALIFHHRATLLNTQVYHRILEDYYHV